LKRTIDPKSASPEIDWYYSIKHVKEAYTGKKPISEVGITREGDDLVITLERPMPTLPFILSMPSAGPIRKDVIEANGGKWDYRHPSTGSYAISVYKPSSEVLLIPNPHARKPGLRPIQIRILQEEVTAMNLFEGGRLDIISSVIPSEADRLRKAGLLQTEPSSQVVYIAMNPTKAPLNDPTWRRAIAAQMDREGLSIAERKLFEPSTSFIPRTLDNGIKLAPIKADAEAVKIRAISPKPKIRLTYAESAVNKIIAEKIQNDLKKSLNLNITLEPMELKMLMSRLFNDPPEMYFLMKGALFDDPIAHLDAFTSIPGPNFARYQSEEYETLLAKVKTLAGGPKRTEAIRAANRLLVEKDVIIVPLLLRMQVFGVSKSLKNFQVSPFQVIDYGALTK
jgi:oligopeptide transport system substrate-binding protein